MNLKPLERNLIVERTEVEIKTKGGLIIPESSRSKKHEGIILAIGSEVKEVAVGDKALFSKWSEKEVEHDGKTYLIMHETDIFAVIK